MKINPKAFLRRCFDCNKDYPNHPGSSLHRGLWRCYACTRDLKAKK